MEFNGIIPRRARHYIVQQHIMRYIFAAAFAKSKKVLDVACGASYGSCYLADYGAKCVVAVDISENALSYANTHYRRDNLYFLQGDAVHLPFHDSTFDVVASFETIEHITEYEIYLREMKRVLSPGGVFICSTPHIKYTKHPPYHVKEFYPDEFFELLENTFGTVQKYGQFITMMTRTHDVLEITQNLENLLRRMVELVPFKRTVKNIIRRVFLPATDSQVYEITAEDIVSFKKNRVCHWESKGVFNLVRIMIAVCKKEE
ncbi:MAG: class I SAM-dependent methyltransferase [Candidatus Methanofastidiosia archaeon]